jgi:hypothetical protein
LKPAGLPLLPTSLRALLFGALLVGGNRDPFAERGTREPVAVDRIEPALVARGRSLRLHGFAPARERAPLVLIAARSGATAASYDPLARHLASHGFAAIVLTREADEVWTRYADALALAARQLLFEAAIPDHPWNGILEAKGFALVADGDAEAAAARGAATAPGVRALVLVDGDDAGPALPWLDRTKAPLLYVGASEVVANEEEATIAGRPSFAASGAERGRRWHVRLHAPGPLLAEGEAAAARPVARDAAALVARFLEAELAAGRSPASLRDLAKLGVVERDCRSGVGDATAGAAANH